MVDAGQKSEGEEDDDEDFGDFDDFEDLLDKVKNSGDRALKNSDMQRHACSLLTQGNQKIKKNPDIITSYTESFTDFIVKWLNKFENTPETNEGERGQATNVACSGWDIHPWKFRFESDRIVVNAKLNKEPLYLEDFCNKGDQGKELDLNDPR
jgi:hypothetical protein